MKEPPTAGIPPWGVDLGAIDRSVAAGDDFHRFANGRWTDSTQVPADANRWGTFQELTLRRDADVRACLAEARRTGAPRGSGARCAIDFLDAFVDTETIDARGLAALQPDLDRIGRLTDHGALARAFGAAHAGVHGVVRLDVVPDPANRERYICGIAPSGLGLVAPDAYALTLDRVPVSDAYARYLAAMFRLVDMPSAARQANRVLDLERRAAELQRLQAASLDPSAFARASGLRELLLVTAAYPWSELLQGAGIAATKPCVIAQPRAVAALGGLFRDADVDTWRAYIAAHLLDALASVLPAGFRDAKAAFEDVRDGSVAAPLPRWREAIALMTGAPFEAPLAEAVGRTYVEAFADPAALAAVREIAHHVREAAREAMDEVGWLSPAARAAAREKLAQVVFGIGGPERWTDYRALVIRRDDAYGNLVRSHAFDRARAIARLGTRVDRERWFLAPQAVNAYYSADANMLALPQALLHPPLFDLAADAAVNYGAIGAVIGHELGHAIDLFGAQTDGRGRFAPWWSAADEASFRTLVGALPVQYAALDPAADRRRAAMTVPENFGDIGGLALAVRAYRRALAGRPPPVRDGFAGLQRLFLAFAQVWREKTRDGALAPSNARDAHASAAVRVNGAVRNIDEWYAAFGVSDAERLYLPRAQRVRPW